MAFIYAERGQDITRARRWLHFVSRNLSLLGDPPKDEKKRERFLERRREIRALYEDYSGWVDYREGVPRRARQHIEASLKIRETPEGLCHLARVCLELGEKDRAREYCARARVVDVRGVFATRVAKIEAGLA